MLFSEIAFTASSSIVRYIARCFPTSNLYGSEVLQRAEVSYELILESIPILIN